MKKKKKVWIVFDLMYYLICPSWKLTYRKTVYSLKKAQKSLPTTTEKTPDEM